MVGLSLKVLWQNKSQNSSSELLYTLHWLPIDKRIIFKTLLYIYKALNDRAPVYLSNPISIFIPTREDLRSSMDILCLDVPRSNRQYGLRSFSQFGPSLWNKVPLAIRTSPTDTVFKKKLKTHVVFSFVPCSFFWFLLVFLVCILPCILFYLFLY